MTSMSRHVAPSGCMQYFRSPSAVIKSFNYGTPIEGRSRYLSNLRYTSCVRVEENFCAIKWETEMPNSFSFGLPMDKGAYNSLVGSLHPLSMSLALLALLAHWLSHETGYSTLASFHSTARTH